MKIDLCINGTNDKIDKLVELTKLPLEIVKTKIIDWWSQGNSTSSYPTAEWIKNHFDTTGLEELLTPTTINIYADTGENADLSNFAYRPVMEKSPLTGEYVTYNTVEGAFQAKKIDYTSDATEEDDKYNLEILEKLKTASGYEARQLGRKIRGLYTKDWDEDSSKIMKEIIYDSFVQNPSEIQKLLDTGNTTLTHTQDKSKWGTEFPRILMEVREELREKYKESNTIPSDANIEQSNQRLTNLVVTGRSSTTALKACEIGGIDALRHPDANGMHFGNPFSFANYTGVLKLVANAREAVVAFEQWLRGEAYQDIEPERRQWILNQINSGELYGKPIVYYTDDITDSEGYHKYDYNTFPNHAHILLKLINELHDTGINIGQPESNGYTNHSGGADGTDSEWDNIGQRYGVKSNHYYHGRKTPRGNIEITQQEFEEGIQHVTKANETLNRRPGQYMDLLARNWMQVKNADSIFAIGTFQSDSIVEGGTGWAVQMAIDENKPVHVFDLNSEKWYQYDYNAKKFLLEDTPILTQNFAGIGTRSIDPKNQKYVGDAKRLVALNAIELVYKQSFSTQEQTETPFEIVSENDPNKISLTKEQSDVVDDAVDFITSKLTTKKSSNPDFEGKRYFTISGMAGTGKTTIVRSIIQTLRDNGIRPKIAVAALSRQAVSVLYEKTKDLKVSPETLHTLSGHKSEYEGWEDKFSIDPKNSAIKKQGYNLVFIDEASMVDEDKFKKFDEFVKNENVCIIYLGDYGQVGPIDESDKATEKKSVIFTSPLTVIRSLTQRIRLGENSPILQYADKFYDVSTGRSSQRINTIPNSETTVQGSGALIFSPTSQMLDDIVESYRTTLESKNFNYTQVVAATNKSVMQHNLNIHNQLFPESQDRICEGDLIVFYKQRIGFTKSKRPYSVDNATRGIVKSIGKIGKIEGIAPYVQTREYVIEIDGEDITFNIIDPDYVNEDGTRNLDMYRMVVKGAYDRARSLPERTDERRDAFDLAHHLSDDFVSTEKNIDDRPDMTFGYAVTVHKSQGSTYDTVFVDKDDILNSGKWGNQNRAEMMYTALTRSRNISVILDSSSQIPILSTSIVQMNDNINNAKKTAAQKHDEILEELGNTTEGVRELQTAVRAAKQGLDYDTIKLFFTKEEREQISQGLKDGAKLYVKSVSRRTDPIFFKNEVIDLIKDNAQKPLSDPTRFCAIEIWSKHDGLPMIEILEACKKYRIAPMVSFSITGLGDTSIEKGVMRYLDMLKRVGDLIKKGYLDPNTTTVRIDPIVPGLTNMNDIKTIVETANSFGIRKFVTSLMQSYGYTTGRKDDRHVISGVNQAMQADGQSYDWERYYGSTNGVINFYPKQEYINEIGDFLVKLNNDNPNLEIQTCAFRIQGLKNSACLDPYIISKLTGVNVFNENGTYDKSQQRKWCDCYGCTQDMFSYSHQCLSSCGYCYAGHSVDNPFQYYDENGVLIENEYTSTTPIEKIEAFQSEEQEQPRQPLQAQFRQPGMPKGMVINESQQSKLYRVFGRKLEYRIEMIARDFEAQFENQRGLKIRELQKQLQNLQGKHFLGRLDESLQIQQNIEILKQNRSEDKEFIIEIIGRDNIINAMLDWYRKYAANGKIITDKDNTRTQDEIKSEYNLILENFNELFNEATERIKSLVGISTQIEDSEDFDDDGQNSASGNEGWGIKMHQVNLKDIVSAKTKQLLSKIPMYKSDGVSFEYDDLGNKRFMNGEVVRKTLIEIMSTTTTPEEFCVYDKAQDKYIAFPVLEEASKKYKWIKRITSFLQKNPDYVDIFYSDMMNDFAMYKTVKDVTDKLTNITQFVPVNLNERSNVEAQLDQIASTLQRRLVLNKNLSIYNSDEGVSEGKGTVNETGIKNAIEKINQVRGEANEIASKEDVTKKFVNNLVKLFEAIGYPVDSELLYSTLKSDDNAKSTINEILEKIGQLIDNVNKNKTNKDYFIFKENRSFYKSIVELSGLVDGFMVTQTFRQPSKSGSKQFTSYSKPNFASMTTKTAKADPQKLFGQFRKDRTFVNEDPNEQNKLYFDLMDRLENEEAVREHFAISYENMIGDKEYEDWSAEDIYRAFISRYFNGNDKGYFDCNSPILSDSPVAMFFMIPKYTDSIKGSFEQKLLPKFRNIVKYEMKRMVRVQQQNESNAKFVNYYNEKGKTFRYFPELNTLHVNQITQDVENDDNSISKIPIYDSDELFIKYYKLLLKDGKTSEADELIDNAINYIMDLYYNEFMFNISKFEDNIRTDLVKSGVISNNETPNRALKEFFWNNTLGEMNIIALFGIDPAYTKNGVDFQKRWKQIYAGGWKLNTAGKYGKKFQNVLYISDETFRSKVYDDIRFAVDKLVKEGKMTTFDRENILRIFNNVNNSDAQALRSVHSFKQIMQMLGKWDEVRDSVEGLYKGQWNREDFNKIYQTIKPFMYCVVEESDGLGGIQLVPHHNKNSEFLLLAMFDMINAGLRNSPKLRGLSRFMEDSGIDVAMYESAVKLGCSKPIDLNYSRNKVLLAIENGYVKVGKTKYYFDKDKFQSKGSDFDKIIHYFEERADNGDPNINQNVINSIYEALQMSEQEVYDLLVSQTGRRSGSDGYEFDEMVVKKQPLDFWSVIQPTPQHFFDSKSVEGSQERNIIYADLPDDFEVTIYGQKFNKQLFIQIYKSLYVEDDLCSLFGEQTKKGRVGGFIQSFINKDGELDIERLVKSALRQIRQNDKYSRVIKEAIQLVDRDGVKKTRLSFTSPQMYQLQDIMFSQAKNSIIKRKTKGGAAILVSDIGLTDELKVKYEYTDGSGKIIDYKEAKALGLDNSLIRLKYVECYLPFHMQEVYEHYLVPVTRTTRLSDGSLYEESYYELDYKRLEKDCPDALKILGMRIPTENKYSITPLRIKGFLPKNNGSAIMVASDITALAGCDFDVDKMFFYAKEIYYDKKEGKMKLVGYNPRTVFNKDGSINLEGVSKLTQKQRTNFKFDLKWHCMTSPHTIGQFQNPSDFTQLKRYARISYLLQNKELLEQFWNENKGKGNEFDILFGSDLDVFDDFLKKHQQERNIATIDTWAYNHNLNMSGGKLIGVYAVGCSQHEKYQDVGISLVEPLTIDGREIKDLDKIFSSNKGLYITKLLSEFLAASVDNVKDPVLANMLQNLDTANFAIWMIRMGFSMLDVTLVFNNPTLVSMFNQIGLFDSKLIDANISRMTKQVASDGFAEQINKTKSVTTQELYDAIVHQSWFEDDKTHSFEEYNSDPYKKATLKSLVFISRMIKLSSPIGALTRISKQDSPKNAPSTLAASMSGYLEVEKFQDNLENYSLMYNGLDAAINNDIVPENTDLRRISIDALRKQLNDTKVSITQAAYTTGYQIPMLLMSNMVFTQNNSNVRQLIIQFNKIQNIRFGKTLNEDLLRRFYERYSYYNLTNTQLFGDDDNMTFAEKYKYYTQVYPSQFRLIKSGYPEIISKYQILQMLDVENNRIILRKSGRLGKDEEDVLIRNLNEMLFSKDKTELELAVNLFMYSFYQEKLSRDHSSFGHLFSVEFIEQFPEYNDCCEQFLINSEDQQFRESFELQFVFNNAEDLFSQRSKSSVTFLNDGDIYTDKPGPKYIMIDMSDNMTPGATQIDFGDSSQEDPLENMQFFVLDQSVSSGTKYNNVTSLVNMIRKSNLYYSGTQNLNEVAEIIENSYADQEVNQDVEQSRDDSNTTQDSGRLTSVSEEITYPNSPESSQYDMDMSAFGTTQVELITPYSQEDSQKELDDPMCTTVDLM